MAVEHAVTRQPDSLAQLEYSAAAKRALARKPALFINNEWVRSTHGATLVVEDPCTGKEISRIVDASDADVDRAVAAARAAFDDGRWSNLPPNKRERIINKLADLLEANAGEFAELEAIDVGKPVGFAKVVDIPASVDHLRYMAGWASKIGGEVMDPQGLPRGTTFSYVSREPVGVAAQIIPWNFPMIMATLKISPALAAGCTLVLKPAEQTSLTALRLADLVAEAGFPPGVINVITGNGHTAGDRLVKHPDVDKIAFTGSTEIGKVINRNATDTLKRVSLELGGKSPVIVMPDVNLEQALPARSSSTPARSASQARACTRTARSSTRWSRASPARPRSGSRALRSIRRATWVRWSRKSRRTRSWDTSRPASATAPRWPWVAMLRRPTAILSTRRCS
jgi:phenylacetaldehyde dehydrogenase